MTRFMHKLAEGLRTREQYLEEHSEHPIFETEVGSRFKTEYNDLVEELKSLCDRIEALAASREGFDENFEREISDEHQRLSVKVDTWAKNILPEDSVKE